MRGGSCTTRRAALSTPLANPWASGDCTSKWKVSKKRSLGRCVSARDSKLDRLPAAAGKLDTHRGGGQARINESRDPNSLERQVQHDAEHVCARHQPAE